MAYKHKLKLGYVRDGGCSKFAHVFVKLTLQRLKIKLNYI